MAKKRSDRPDAERRVRQCVRFARQLRVLRLVMGHGRWDAEAIARELECSVRMVYRDIQVLVLADVPVYFDDKNQTYKVREGYRFPGLDSSPAPQLDRSTLRVIHGIALNLQREAQKLIRLLHQEDSGQTGLSGEKL